jgi:hypothetical protein
MIRYDDDLSLYPPRIVTPRKRTYPRRPVIAIHNGETLNENGEIGTVDALIYSLRNLETPTLFSAIQAADFVADLDTMFARDYPTTWQWRVNDHERDISPNGVRIATRITTIVHWFGFRKNNRFRNNGRSGGVFHKIIDPVSVYGTKLDKIWPGDEPPLVRLLQWAVAIRDFCDDNNIEVRPTGGGIGAQFLTDSRFYPDARRKVPRATNDTIREHLPGNFYSLDVIPSNKRDYSAYYVDQHRAHHYHARTVPMPDSNGLYAMGRFLDLAEYAFADVWDNFCGLYCLDLDVPTRRRGNSHVTRWLGYPPSSRILEKQYIYSNELSFLGSMGYTVRGVRAAWGSHREDTGLSKYSEWAETQLDQYGDPSWLKPILLATYGTLATRPRIQESVFRLAMNGESVTLHTGRNTLTGLRTRGRMKLEPVYANVLHRGMIEAATRIESLSYSHYLTSKGYRVLSVYADAVIIQVDEDKELPLIIDPWRLKRTLTHLQWVNKQAFISDQETKLPGVGGRELIPYRQETPGYAPRIIRKWEAVTGHAIDFNIFTGKEVSK